MISGPMEKAFLVLEDSTVFSGYSVGKRGTTVGEVVFNTCTASYEEVLSDPTYYGQIVAQTYPLVGNRGVESTSAIAANGYIVREWCDTPSDAHGDTLDVYLKKLGIIGICGIDTRALTRKIRGSGYVKGAITDSIKDMDALLEQIRLYSIRGAVSAVTVPELSVLTAEPERYRVAVMDYGTPDSLLKALAVRGCTIYRFPAGATAEELKSVNPDGVVFSDGPGDPDEEPSLIAHIREILELGLPFMGIGLGHQMFALALGASVQKMEHGHRGSNQPVRRLSDGKLWVTVQNHGYCIAPDSIDPAVLSVTMVNVSDQTIEAVRAVNYPGETYQFTPVDSKDINSTGLIYDDFIAQMREGQRHA